MRNYKNLLDLKNEPIEKVAFMGALMCNWWYSINRPDIQADLIWEEDSRMYKAGTLYDPDIDIPLY